MISTNRKNCSVIIDTAIVLYKKQEGRPKFMGSAKISCASVTGPGKLQRHLHGIDLNREPSSDLIVIRAAVNQKDSFLNPYLYEIRCTSMDEDLETLWDVSKYGSYVWDPRAIREIGYEGKKSLSQSMSEQDLREREGRGGDETEIVEGPVSNIAHVMYVLDGTAVNFCVFKVSDHPQTDVLVRFEQIGDLNIPQHDVSLSQLTLLRPSFRMYGLDDSGGTLSVNVYPRESANDMTTPFTGGMKVGLQLLNNSAKVFLQSEGRSL